MRTATSLLVIGLLAATVGEVAWADDSPEVARLKERIAALEKENADLKAQLRELKGKKGIPPSLSDMLATDTKVSGDYRFMNGDGHTGEWSITITERDGKRFKGTYFAKGHPADKLAKEEDVEGEIVKNKIKVRTVNTSSRWYMSGELKGKSLTMLFESQGGGRAEMVAKVP